METSSPNGKGFMRAVVYRLHPFIRQWQLIVVAVLGFSVGVATDGCSTNPATGKRQLNLVSEQQEIQMGKDADQQVRATMGVYNDPQLQSYIQAMGKRLAQTSERPNLPWTFTVVDDPVVNAFALPGGFIYVTRGILSYLSNEAELAGVMGHEIGHVTAQHSVNMMSKQELAQLGLGIGMILKPEWQQYGQLAGAGLQVLFLKFSRDDESQADQLGLRYMQRINEDPRQMADVMTMLDRVTQSAGGGQVPQWLETHPDPGNRREAILAEIQQEGKNLSGTTVGRDQYLATIQNIVFGDNPRDGFFKGTTFYHPDLKFKMDFPAGWKTQNTKEAVIAVSPNQDAALQLSMAEGTNPQDAANKFFTQQGVTGQGLRNDNIHGFAAVSGGFSAATQQGNVAGQVTFLQMGNGVLQLLGYAAQQGWSGYQSAVANAVQTFDHLTDPAILNAQPMRLKIVTIPTAMTLQEFNQKYPSSIPIDQLAIINNVDKNGRLSAGQKVKQVVGQKFQ